MCTTVARYPTTLHARKQAPGIAMNAADNKWQQAQHYATNLDEVGIFWADVRCLACIRSFSSCFIPTCMPDLWRIRPAVRQQPVQQPVGQAASQPPYCQSCFGLGSG
jgi:hypothetical protein